MRKQKLVERMVEGSLRQKELTVADLPNTRKQVYRDLFKHRFGTLSIANFFNALFWIPFFVWYYFVDFYVIDKIQSNSEISGDLFNLVFLEYGTMIPLFILGCVGLSGFFYIIRRMCWGESISLIYDFRKGIKQSWKQFAFIGFIIGALVLLLEYILYYYSIQVLDNTLINIALYGITLIVFILMIMVLIFIFPMSSLYQISNFILLKGSLFCAIKYLPKNILILLISLFPFLVLVLMPSILVRFIGIILLLFFGAIHVVIIWTLYSHSVFDIHINKTEYPKYVKKGLYLQE
ncbi:MAG: hypothetical protein PHX62_07755 [Bacilli bacterium]|nr:hypothetical protein [Bacilli bacterium]